MIATSTPDDAGASTFNQACDVRDAQASGAEIVSMFDLLRAKEELRAQATITPTDNSGSAIRLESLREAALSELDQYARLPVGWDGYAGSEFSSESIAAAKRLVQTIGASFQRAGKSPRKLTPGPVGDGSIDLEVTSRDRCLLLTIAPHAPGTLHLYASAEDLPEVEIDVAFDQAIVERWVAWVVSADARTPAMAQAG